MRRACGGPQPPVEPEGVEVGVAEHGDAVEGTGEVHQVALARQALGPDGELQLHDARGGGEGLEVEEHVVLEAERHAVAGPHLDAAFLEPLRQLEGDEVVGAADGCHHVGEAHVQVEALGEQALVGDTRAGGREYLGPGEAGLPEGGVDGFVPRRLEHRGIGLHPGDPHDLAGREGDALPVLEIEPDLGADHLLRIAPRRQVADPEPVGVAEGVDDLELFGAQVGAEEQRCPHDQDDQGDGAQGADPQQTHHGRVPSRTHSHMKPMPPLPIPPG